MHHLRMSLLDNQQGWKKVDENVEKQELSSLLSCTPTYTKKEAKSMIAIYCRLQLCYLYDQVVKGHT